MHHIFRITLYYFNSIVGISWGILKHLYKNLLVPSRFMCCRSSNVGRSYIDYVISTELQWMTADRITIGMWTPMWILKRMIVAVSYLWLRLEKSPMRSFVCNDTDGIDASQIGLKATFDCNWSVHSLFINIFFGLILFG